MNWVDQNINKDMIDFELIDVESLDLNDNQTWLCTVPQDSGHRVDIIDWSLSCDWPFSDDEHYQQMETQLNNVLDSILKDEVAAPDKHRFDSRTYVKPKRRTHRPSIQNIVEVTSNPTSMSPSHSLNPPASLNPVNKYLTYNKYNSPMAVSPMLRLKTFNVDVNSDNSNAVKEYAMKRRSLVQDDDPQLEDADVTLLEASGRLSMDHMPSKPINIDLTQPAHNLHNTFNKGITNAMNDRGSLNMYQSGESLMRMSPPSLVSSLLMDTSGVYTMDQLEDKKSLPSHKDSGVPLSGRDSIDPMMTSMTLSILDEKDMSTSLLSQTTYPDNDSLMESLPPSLVSSVNSSFVISSTKPKENDSNVFSSATFTHLEQSERLLSARPRCQLYNSFTKRDSIRNSESYTKSREEACQIDPVKVLNENTDKKESPKAKPNVDMTETITLHYSNNKFRDAEKENFERDDAFYKDMGMPRPEDIGRGSLNVTLGKQELNEIIQARQKLSLARKALPTEPEKPLPNQVDSPPIKTIQLPNQTITVPKQSMENASELLSRRRALNGFDKAEESTRDTPKRNSTFKKVTRRENVMDATLVFSKAEEPPPADNNIIDINSATMNLLAGDVRTSQEEWCPQSAAMVGSSESASEDTATFSSSSPPDTAPHPDHDPRTQVASTPLMSLRRGAQDLISPHTTISPIYDSIEDKPYLAKAQSMERTYDMQNTTVINSATIVRKPIKRDILAGQKSPEKLAPQIKSPSKISPTSTASHGLMVGPAAARHSNLPTSKLRQYSSHRDLTRIPGGGGVAGRGVCARPMVRSSVYASNPALSPTAGAPPAPSHTQTRNEEERPARPTLANPPALVRQGTETLRRERPQSQLVAPRDLRVPSAVPLSYRNHHMPPPSRPYSIAGASQLRTVSRPSSGPPQKPAPVPVTDQPRPSSGTEARVSALPRPSRLPAPRKTIRPPSVYSVGAHDPEHY